MLLVAVLLGLAAGGASHAHADWKVLAPGMEFKWLAAKKSSPVGDSRIAVVRVDPTSWQLELVGRSQTGDSAGRTAREWANAHGLAVTINAGMFGRDYKTHVGYMEFRGHVNSSRVNGYLSVAAFDPRDRQHRPPFRIFDLDTPGITMQAIRQEYASLVQNLRLIKRPGTSRWSQQDKRWSEAALGEDLDGRVLLVLSRAPFSMHDLNRELLSAGIGLVAAQHLEGGPQAQLYVNVGGAEMEVVGRSGTSVGEDGGSAIAWPIPFVLGIRQKSVTH
jgi:Phosphodiester glycosidase